MSDHPDPLRLELDRLARSGAAAADPIGLRFVRALLDRADRYGGGTAERLRTRAKAALERIARRLAAETRTCADDVRALARRGLDPAPIEAAIERGDLVAARRSARRYRDRNGRGRALRLQVTPAVRPQDTARRRRSRPRAAAAEPTDTYRAPLAELVTELSLARTRRTLPAENGPYNGRVVAARLLETVAALSPRYAHTQLERMHELAALSLLPEPAARKRPGKRS